MLGRMRLEEKSQNKSLDPNIWTVVLKTAAAKVAAGGTMPDVSYFT